MIPLRPGRTRGRRAAAGLVRHRRSRTRLPGPGPGPRRPAGPGDHLAHRRTRRGARPAPPRPARRGRDRGPRHSARRVVPLGEAAAEPWIDLRCEVGCCRDATSAAFQQAGFEPRRVVEADEYWPAQGFVAAGLGLALIPALALGVLHPGVAVRRLRPATQPERHVLAVTRPAISDTTPVQAILTALQAHATPQPGSTP